MWRLFITITICSQNVPFAQCTPKSNEARAVIAYTAPEGILVCGLPATMPVSSVSPSETEYARTRCELKN